ncbi:acyltransferase [Paraburkholderia agricolaris]|uniref:acyltransferase family protein n=1 Tax=Paraburkholderia agricolaris TaxID=2152888 RepID=UPI00129135D5|nr:acyltransferase [Paraburkholderia agricolaris]
MKSTENSVTSSQWAILAALRFFLAAVVALGHFALFVRHDPTHIFGDAYLNPGSAVFGFFILSGFSIAASVDRESKGFFRRRFLRIWPLYLATIVFGLCVELLIPNGFPLPFGGTVPTASGLSIVASLLMLQTIISGPIPIVGQIWSLSPEWWHYMIAPWLKKVSDKLLMIWVMLSLTAFLTINPPIGHGIDVLSHGLPFLNLSWLWITGFLYYRLKGTAAGFAILAFPSVFALTLGHFTGAPLFISIFVVVMSAEVRISPKLIKVCNFLGDLSFPLYLFHFPAMVLALRLGSNRSAITLAAMLAASVAALYLVDYPSRKLFGRNAARAAATQSDRLARPVKIGQDSA